MAMMPPIVRTKQLRSYFDFRGGLNTDAAPDNMLDNELARADNVDLLERGGFVKRKGYIRLNEDHYGGQVEQLFEWPRSDGQVWLMAVITIGGVSKLYRVLEDQGYTLQEVATLAGPKVGYVAIPNPGPEGTDKPYVVDGQQYRVWDGETVKLISDTIPDPPDEPPEVEAVDVPAGVEQSLEPGVYRCAITYATGLEGLDLPDVGHIGEVLPIGIIGAAAYALKYFVPSEAKDHIPLGESDPSDVVTVNLTGAQHTNWRNFPRPPPEVKAILLYRSTANGSDLQFVGALKHPPPNSFGDVLPDDELVERRTMRFGNNL